MARPTNEQILEHFESTDRRFGVQDDAIRSLQQSVSELSETTKQIQTSIDGDLAKSLKILIADYQSRMNKLQGSYQRRNISKEKIFEFV